MTSRINIRQLRSHTDCAQRWKSAVIRTEECYTTKSGTYNNLVIKRSTFPLLPLKECLSQCFADIRNTKGVGLCAHSLVGSCGQPPLRLFSSGTQTQALGWKPKQGVTVQAHSADARTAVPYSWLYARASLRAAFAFGSCPWEISRMQRRHTFTYCATDFSHSDCEAFVSLAQYQSSPTFLLLL